MVVLNTQNRPLVFCISSNCSKKIINSVPSMKRWIMITNKHLRSYEIDLINLISSQFENYREEIERQINEAEIGREEYAYHLFLDFSYPNGLEFKKELPWLMSIAVACEDGDEVVLSFHRFRKSYIEELEVYSGLMYDLDVDKICKGRVVYRHFENTNGLSERWELNRETNQLELVSRRTG